MLRDKTCNELSKKDVGTTVTLAGWVHSIRDHGGVLFVDLRDKYGFTQIVFDNLDTPIKREFVIQVTGEVRKRTSDTINTKISTGEVELHARNFTVLGTSAMIPFEIEDSIVVNDDTRLRYRFLDLRRQKMQQNLTLRHKANLAARIFLDKEGFVEIETPYLVRSTPEGARDYVVPSRVNIGSFYALPQSPQLYKQILMVAGSDKYFQFARCFRDEDLRADRQPEHTQLDLEMSFAEQDDVFKVMEGIISSVVPVFGKKVKTPFPRLTYSESMQKYGTDKPDLRFGLEIIDVTDIVKDSKFSVFNAVVKSGGKVKMLNPEMVFGRNEFDSYIKYVQEIGGKGMAWMIREDGLDSNIVKYFPDAVQKKLIDVSKKGSLLFIADTEKNASAIAGKLRVKIAQDKGLIDTSKLSFAWVTDFPLFSFNEDTERWEPEHHMFTMPKKDSLQYLEKEHFDPGKVIAECYDFVLNGVELSSGSVRITNPEIQRKVMNVVNYTDEEIAERFGFLLNVYQYGAPPHAGFGLGFDRLTALLLGYDDIREVIAFPKNKNAQSLVDNCPSPITAKQMKELKIKLDVVKR